MVISYTDIVVYVMIGWWWWPSWILDPQKIIFDLGNMLNVNFFRHEIRRSLSLHTVISYISHRNNIFIKQLNSILLSSPLGQIFFFFLLNMWPLKRGLIHMNFSMKGQEKDEF
jgi:hypothetical protein